MRIATIAILAALASAIAMSAACDSEDASGPVENDAGGNDDAKGDGRDDANTADAGADADLGERPLAPPRAVTCAAQPCAVELVSVGTASEHRSAYCARLDDGSVRCWGTNLFGLLARGDAFTAEFSEWPEPALGLGKTSRLAGSLAGSLCALGEDGFSRCWGNNSGGQIGRYADDAGTPSSEGLAKPEIPLGAPKGMVFVGKDLGCAVPEAGAPICWGVDDHGGRLSRVLELVNAVAMPLDVGGADLVELAIGERSVIARTRAGGLLSWGIGSGAYPPTTLGRWTSIDPSPPTPIELGASSSVTSGAVRACAITTRGVFCWGKDREEYEVTGQRLPSYVRFSTTARADRLASGYLVDCATFEDGSTHCWGDNRYGQLGVGDVVGRPTPASVRGLAAAAVQVAVGEDSVCALLQDGRVQCWGANAYGQLGTGTVDVKIHHAPEFVKWQR